MEPDAHPMIFVGIHIAEQDGCVIDAVDHNVDFSVIEQIAKCCPTSRNHVCQTGTLNCRQRTSNFLPLTYVVEK